MLRQWGPMTILMFLMGATTPFSQQRAAQEGYVGVAVAAMPPDLAKDYGIRGPAVVAASVLPNGPAYKSGLRDEDMITSIDGKPVSDPSVAVNMLKAHLAGEKVRIGLVHLTEDGRKFTIEIGVMVEAKPNNYGNASYGGPVKENHPQANTQNQAKTGTANAGGPLRVVGQDAPQGVPKQSGYCRAYAPQDWTMRSRPQGDTADLDGAGGRAHASWGMVPINTAMRAYYGDMYGPPDVATLAVATVAAHGQARWTGQPKLIGNFYTARNFETAHATGILLYHAYPVPMQGQYILGMHMAWVDKSAAKLLPAAEAVMVSIQCQTQLRPVESTLPGDLPRPGDHKIRSNDPEGDSLKDYNVQLGTQWAHSPSTGEHYMLDYATQWNNSGPNGPGYYRKAGNSYEKLETGW